MNKKILVSILNWNNNSATNKCLYSLSLLPKDKQPDIRLVDNASKDEPLELDDKAISTLRSLKVVRNTHNLGFAGGHNVSLRYAMEKGYSMVVLLNNDAQILDKNVFDELLAAIANNPRCIAASPTVLGQIAPERIWFGGGVMSSLVAGTHHLRQGQSPSNRSIEPSSFLTGACLAIDVSKLRKWGQLINEDYFLYWEDADWCARATKAGYELLYVPHVKIYHAVSSSLGLRSTSYAYYNIRNNLLFIKRHTPLVFRPVAYMRVLYITSKYVAHAILRHTPDTKKSLTAIMLGWLDGLRNKHGELKAEI